MIRSVCGFGGARNIPDDRPQRRESGASFTPGPLSQQMGSKMGRAAETAEIGGPVREAGVGPSPKGAKMDSGFPQNRDRPSPRCRVSGSGNLGSGATPTQHLVTSSS
jgi:hypothetical protein